MLVLIDQTTIIGGVVYEPSHSPQSVNDAAGEHLIAIGNARRFETKVVAPTEKKSQEPSSASQPAPASRKRTATRRRRTT